MKASLRAIFDGHRPPLQLIGLDLDVVDEVRSSCGSGSRGSEAEEEGAVGGGVRGGEVGSGEVGGERGVA